MGSAVSLSDSLALRHPAEAGHAARVTALALRIAGLLGVAAAPTEALALGGPLHDLGKLAVDEAILRKPGPLDPPELAQIRTHPEIGARMLGGVRSLRAALPCVLHHHERWDGTGYPHRLEGTAIPLEARILAVADAFDAMVSERPYRAALAREDARSEVGRCSGTQFDPDVASAFLSLDGLRLRAAS